MKLFTFEEVKDIQETWKKSHDRARTICSLADKYLCSEEEIDRVLRGDKNITSYAQIKAVKVSGTKQVAIKTKEAGTFKSIVEDAVKEFNAENTDQPKKKGGWPKGKPRKKVEIKGEISQETFDTLKNLDMCTPTIHPAVASESMENLINSLYDTFQKDVTIRVTNKDTDVIIDSLKSRRRYLDSQVLELTKEIVKINDSIAGIDYIIDKLEKAAEDAFKEE